jgi:ribosomal protein S18
LAPAILVSRRAGGSDSCVRLFSNDGKDNGKDGPDHEKEAVGRDDAMDLFGLSGHGDEDNSSSTTKSGGGGISNPVDWLGPPETWPPKYKRDAATGRLLVEEVEEELTDRDRQILQADPLERDQMTLKQLERHWTKQAKGQRPSATSDDRGDGSSDREDGGSGPADVIDQLGRRIRETDMSTNVLGRSVTAQMAGETLDDGSFLGRDETGFSQHLTPAEFKSFQAYMQRKHDLQLGGGDLPVQEASPASAGRYSSSADDEMISADDARLSMQWLTQRAQRQMDDLAMDDNPYSDLMPGDLSPTRLVNRKRAKLIPRELLHHNNVELLQYFMTPTGQIKNRIQTRLGAKDQRKVARLIKRARALGLVPHVGQFKVEKHGWIHAEDIHKDRPWEKKLAERGLVIRRQSKVRETATLEAGPSPPRSVDSSVSGS